MTPSLFSPVAAPPGLAGRVPEQASAGARQPRLGLPRLRLRTLLVGLVLAVLLPSLGFGVAATWHAVAAQRTTAEERLRDTARALALALDRQIETYRSAMALLAESPLLDDPEADLAPFDSLARRGAASLGTNVVLLDGASRRQFVNTALPAGEAPGATSALDLRAVVETGRPQVSDLVIGAVLRQPSIAVAVPVEREGRVRFVLAARLAPERLQRLLAAQDLPAGSFASVADSRGTVVAHSDPKVHAFNVGQAVNPMSARAIAGSHQGLYRAVSPDGVERVYGFQKLDAAPGWTLVIAQPAAMLDAAWRQSVRALALGGSLALAIGASLALLVARGILVPLGRLRRHAQALAEAGPAGAAPTATAAIPPAPIAELEALRRGFAEAEAALRGGEARFRGTFEQAAVGMALVGLDGAWLQVNEKLCAITGYSRAELLGLSFQDITHPEHLTADLAQVEALLAGEIATYTIEKRYIRRDGSPVWVNLTVALVHDACGAAQHFISVIEDISARKAAEQALAESEARLHDLLATLDLGAFMTRDMDGTIRHWSKGCESLYGWTAEEAVGRIAHDLLRTRFPVPLAEIEAVLERDGEWTGDLHQSTRDEREVVVTVRKVLRRDAKGAPAAVLDALTDVTARREAEAARALLVREVDHRAKNALAIALSLVRMAPRDDAHAFAAGVEGRIAAMARAHSLLAMGKWSGAALRSLAEGELAAHPGRVRLSGPEARLHADAVQPLAMLLHELATNAAKYGALSAPGGVVEIGWDFDGAGGGLRLRWVERGGPMITAPPARRGFGSRLLATLAERQLGGRLGFDWQPEGLRVSLDLAPGHAAPAASTGRDQDGAMVPRPALSPGVNVPSRPPRVLLVEDDALLAMEIETALRDLGCEVAGPARSLTEAVRLAADEAELHAAVLDVNLGGDERVFPAADLLATRGVPVLFSTGYGSAESLEGREALAVAVLRKPYPREALASALQEALRRRQGVRLH